MQATGYLYINKIYRNMHLVEVRNLLFYPFRNTKQDSWNIYNFQHFISLIWKRQVLSSTQELNTVLYKLVQYTEPCKWGKQDQQPIRRLMGPFLRIKKRENNFLFYTIEGRKQEENSQKQGHEVKPRTQTPWGRSWKATEFQWEI